MKYHEYSEKLEHLQWLIKTQQLRSLSQAAEKYSCSISTVKRMIENLRIKGNDVKYCKKNRFFFLDN
jgi:transposase